jgi:SecD/SecF fusion protein
MAANETLKKTEATVEKSQLKILSALLTNGKDSAATKKEITLLDKIIAQGGGPVLGLPKDTATVNGIFKTRS